MMAMTAAPRMYDATRLLESDGGGTDGPGLNLHSLSLSISGQIWAWLSGTADVAASAAANSTRMSPPLPIARCPPTRQSPRLPHACVTPMAKLCCAAISAPPGCVPFRVIIASVAPATRHDGTPAVVDDSD